MNYVLGIYAIGYHPKVSIDEERYKKIKTSQKVLMSSLDIEILYEILIRNYLQLEKEIINETLYTMLKQHIAYKSFFNMRLNFNMAISNLLTSIRMYEDQLPNHIGVCLPQESGVKKKMKQWLEDQYKSCPNSKFMHSLRNHVQHAGLPVHSISSGSRWTSLDEDGRLEFKTDIFSSKDILERDKIFREQISDDKIDLKLAIRTHIELLSEIQENVRGKIQDSVDDSRSEFESIIAFYKEKGKENVTGLYAMRIDGDKIIEKVPILLDMDNMRLELCKNNKQLPNLDKRYVTGEINCKN